MADENTPILLSLCLRRSLFDSLLALYYNKHVSYFLSEKKGGGVCCCMCIWIWCDNLERNEMFSQQVNKKKKKGQKNEKMILPKKKVFGRRNSVGSGRKRWRRTFVVCVYLSKATLIASSTIADGPFHLTRNVCTADKVSSSTYRVDRCCVASRSTWGVKLMSVQRSHQRCILCPRARFHGRVVDVIHAPHTSSAID